MNLTLLLALTLSESTKLHQSFQRRFIPLKKGRVKDAVGTRLIGYRRLGLVPIALYFPLTVKRFGQKSGSGGMTLWGLTSTSFGYFQAKPAQAKGVVGWWLLVFFVLPCKVLCF